MLPKKNLLRQRLCNQTESIQKLRREALQKNPFSRNRSEGTKPAQKSSGGNGNLPELKLDSVLSLTSYVERGCFCLA